MPEANYGLKPAPNSDLRTYGQLIGHQTDDLFNGCATIKGVPSPSPAQSNEKKATKAELVKALADALAFCDGAIAALTDQNALQMIKRGEGEAARARRGDLRPALARPRVGQHRRRLFAPKGHRASLVETRCGAG